jgi:Sigma-54 interaction domain
MTNPSTAIAGGTRVVGRSDSVAQHREDWRVARAVHADLVLLGMPRVNLLLTGTDGVISNVLDTLVSDLDEPIARWSSGERLVLAAGIRPRTLILRNVGALSHEDQLRLGEWLDRAPGHTRVVSTTTAPLWPRVTAGFFMEPLYYRLNTVAVDVTA